MKKLTTNSRHVRRLVVAGLLASLPMGQISAANTWKSNFPVHSVVAHQNGFELVLEASDPACGPSGNLFTVQEGLNDQSAEGVKRLLAVALFAMATGKTVNALVDTSISGCPVQQLQVNP